MPKQRTQYICDECGAEFPQWFGKCPACDTYGSLTEQVVPATSSNPSRPSLSGNSWMREGGGDQNKSEGQPRSSFKLSQIAEQSIARCSSGYGEMDRVLGGGIVPGSLVLIGGEPGIGKSTLLLQVASNLALDHRILYVSGEESGLQVKLRAQRLISGVDNGVLEENPPQLPAIADEMVDIEQFNSNEEELLSLSAALPQNPFGPDLVPESLRENDNQLTERLEDTEPLEETQATLETATESVKPAKTAQSNEEPRFYLLPETDLEEILRELESLKPYLAVIDSIQTIYFPSLTSAPGSVAQVRECTSALMQVAKRENITLFIVGHVTKEGGIAGPRVLEHLVDTVLFFEGDRFASHRLLRSMKNRFGATHEIGVFEMVANGLKEVANPSELFIGSREEFSSGSSTIVACEGTRPIVVELQALVSPASFGSPRRATTGIDSNRLVQILAVLEKRVGVPLSKLDTYVSSVGGLNVSEPAADLGVAIAVVASFRDRIVDPHTVIIGEVGLGGQVRPVSQLELRLREAAKLGFKRAIVPHGQNPPDLGLEVISVSKVLDAIIEAIPGPANQAFADTPNSPESSTLLPGETNVDNFVNEFDDDFDDDFDSENPVF
ncbi:DNA repair protein RadA [Laspinema sp. A4]|uniref:DNA repair protein RadA n=1 Tax=Laspinema sp. D2d TaxID=2953686 RepID=UPI0021BB10BC|nr:DNA repair protein RadA [Laspinema sp. D2d]MCT7983574.1 DNA repair protein RadA [Laspinema sp. D2d]